MSVLPRRVVAAMVGGLGLLLVGCTAPPTAAPGALSTRAAPPAAGATLPSSASPSAKPSSVASPSAAGSTGAAARATSVATEQPVAAETNPAGDIPDNQVFVVFASSSGGYQLQVPEGWARTDNNTDVHFVSNNTRPTLLCMCHLNRQNAGQ